jgi:hypothetical protein
LFLDAAVVDAFADGLNPFLLELAEAVKQPNVNAASAILLMDRIEDEGARHAENDTAPFFRALQNAETKEVQDRARRWLAEHVHSDQYPGAR